MFEIDSMKPVDESMIWNLLNRFYSEQGPMAWEDELVPQGATSNAFTADTYANIVSAFIRDLKKNGNTCKPLIIELGGGSGKFAWQFLNRLINYHSDGVDNISKDDFIYVLTDAMESNLNNWRNNKRFGKYVEKGILKFAQIIIDESPRIIYQDGSVTPEDMSDVPIIFIANYLFDSIPTSLFATDGGKLFEVHMSLETSDEDYLKNPISTFKPLKAKFSRQSIGSSLNSESNFNKIIDNYKVLEEPCLVPASKKSFGFLESFLKRSAPTLMLAGDLAYADPADFPEQSPFIFESYFAHYTNFHMFSELFKIYGGGSQVQRHLDINFCAGAFIAPGVSGSVERFSHTQLISKHFLQEFNPYDANELNDLLKENLGEASVRQILAWMRFSRFDPDVAQACLGRVFEQLQQGQEDIDFLQLYESFMEAYRAFFPEKDNVKFDYTLVQLLLAINYDDEALRLIEQSLADFGPSPERLYVHALALLRKDLNDLAKISLLNAMEIDPNFGPVKRLFNEKFNPSALDITNKVADIQVEFSDPDLESKAEAIFSQAGAVLIDGMLDRNYVEELKVAFEQRVDEWKNSPLGKPNNVGDKRLTVPIRMRPPFNNPALFANPVLLNLLSEAMGDKPVLHAFGAVVTYKGAKMQHIHREHPLLFTSDTANAGLPTYAVTVLMPLIDLTEEMGGTQLWPGTHLEPAGAEWKGEPTIVHTKAGSCLTFDYRVFHGGLPCNADGLRPMLYLTYCLPWFTDTLAFESHAALGISQTELLAIPEEHRGLFRFAKRIPDSPVGIA
jgi:tetratricopeptide (TPR) repeat protein